MHQPLDEQDGLDLLSVESLLVEQGYRLMCRFGHVHAATDGEELHLCLIADLALMSPSRFLERLNEASRQSLRHVLSLKWEG